MQTITPFLWFNNNAEEAIEHYSKIFKNVTVKQKVNGPDGKLMTASFEINGQPFIALNGGPMFQFTEAISFVASADTQQEIDHLWNGLCEGGTPSRCGWLKDKFGLSWQIVPPVLPKLLGDPDRTKAKKVMEAMMQMDKIDIAKLQAAYDQ